ncbi:MAG: tetratricopeptide repeat protein, partial [Phycisphaerales bacterium]
MNRTSLMSKMLATAFLLGAGAPVAIGAPAHAASNQSTDSAPIAETAPTTPRAAETIAIDPATQAARIREAQRLLDAGDFATAEPLLAEARVGSGDPRLAYNLGLCAFEAGRFAEAATLFEEAALAADASLARDAMFNQGNARYREGVQLVESVANPAPDAADSSEQAIESLQQALVPLRAALTHFRDAVRSNRADRDA